MDKGKILERLGFLAEHDGKFHKNNYDGFITFGAAEHKFILNPVLPEADVKNFEREHNIELPKDYFYFVTNIGNGGAGPGYGLLPLETWSRELADPPAGDFLNTPFPHTAPWNDTVFYELDDDGGDDFYHSNKYVTGAIRIAHYGCGIMYMLVVTGNEKGHIWVDDRCSDYGIYPAANPPVGFETWYTDWLEKSAGELSDWLEYGNKH
ncbi:MAG: SMI1/KNR4 family protein [Spirochaetes bacterium]|nr:SMI1/KNR4 family protein [Spirochaetota bacterium]